MAPRAVRQARCDAQPVSGRAQRARRNGRPTGGRVRGHRAAFAEENKDPALTRVNVAWVLTSSAGPSPAR